MGKIKKQQQNITAITYDKKGNILSIGKNSYVKTHPKQAHYATKVGKPDSIFLHAEMDAIIKLAKIDQAYKISIFRVGKNLNLMLAKPCNICQLAIEQGTNIKIIEYTTNAGIIIQENVIR